MWPPEDFEGLARVRVESGVAIAAGGEDDLLAVSRIRPLGIVASDQTEVAAVRHVVERVGPFQRCHPLRDRIFRYCRHVHG